MAGKPTKCLRLGGEILVGLSGIVRDFESFHTVVHFQRDRDASAMIL